MSETKLPRGTKVVCVEHDGAHAGVVVHDLGFGYGVAWLGLNVDPAVGRTHGKDAAHVAYDAVRSAPLEV
jgi:hypothetical protein